MDYKYLFGPVPSRRLGVSLGIDLLPFKTCSLNCVYCECGETTRLTVKREEYVPVKEVLEELYDYLKGGPELDYVTFSGSGEPVLHNKIGRVVDFIKKEFPNYKVVVLTNGTLFMNKEVCRAVKHADLIVPSLDAAEEEVFKKINRPHPSLLCSEVISGLVEFRREYCGEINLEVFVLPGINDGKEHLELLKKAIGDINPDRVQLSALDRPGAEPWVETAGKEKLQEIATYLGDTVEVVGKFKSRTSIPSYSMDKEKNILSTLKRRPCTPGDLAEILNLPPAEINKYLQSLLEKQLVECEYQGRGKFYKVRKVSR